MIGSEDYSNIEMLIEVLQKLNAEDFKILWKLIDKEFERRYRLGEFDAS